MGRAARSAGERHVRTERDKRLMPRTDELSSRERSRLAREHKETDRVPIAMVCSGINEPARSQFDAYLKREHDTSFQAYLDTFLDISPVGLKEGPSYEVLLDFSKGN